MMHKKKILIVDDEPALRRSLSLILQEENYEVETAADGEEALHCLRSREYDLMFLDLSLPGISGIDLLAKIHRQFAHMPVLILTAHAALDTAMQAVRLGARDYLIKPADPATILTRVAEIFAETEQPPRMKEIVGEIQSLLAELQTLEGRESTPTSTLAAVPPVHRARFLKKGMFELDLHTRHATLRGRYIPVTGVYFDYLSTLLHHAPNPVGCRILVKESQGYDVEMLEARELARWRIHELRKIIEADPEQPQYIQTVRGLGYRLEPG